MALRRPGSVPDERADGLVGGSSAGGALRSGIRGHTCLVVRCASPPVWWVYLHAGGSTIVAEAHVLECAIELDRARPCPAEGEEDEFFMTGGHRCHQRRQQTHRVDSLKPSATSSNLNRSRSPSCFSKENSFTTGSLRARNPCDALTTRSYGSGTSDFRRRLGAEQYELRTILTLGSR